MIVITVLASGLCYLSCSVQKLNKLEPSSVEDACDRLQSLEDSESRAYVLNLLVSVLRSGH